jgi:uncharacterized membrane protein
MFTWIIALAGLGLRLLAVRSQGTYWFDEAFSVHFASMPFGDAVSYLIRDVHPTLYYLLLHFWIAAFGDGEAIVRTLSVLTGTGAILATAALARRAFGKEAGNVAAFLVALSPLLIFQSAEARMYPLLILLVALQANEYLKLMEDPKRSAGGWAVLSGLALFTHLTAATPFLVMAGHRLWTLRKDRRQMVHAGLTMLLAATPFLCWLVIAATGRGGSVGSEWQVNPDQGSLVPLSWHFTSFFVNDAANWQRAFVFVALVVFTLRALFDLKRDGQALAWRVTPNPDRRAWLLAALTVMPFLAFVGVTTAVTKYFVVAVPAAAVLVAGGFIRCLPAEPKARRLVLILAAVIFAAIVAPVDASLSVGERIRYDEVARFIEAREKPGDVVYASWFPTLLPLERQYHGQSAVYAINPFEKTLSLDEALILHAGQAMTQQDLDAAQAVMESRIKDAPDVFLVTGATGLEATPVELWFSHHGWILEDTYKTTAWSPIVYQLRRP